MNELLKIFEYENLELRTITEGETVWVALSDVCKILDISNSGMVAKTIDEDDKCKFNLHLSGKDPWFVNEAGLYSVILTSRSKKARYFRRWVTHDVLPTLRKQGYYSLMTDEELIEIITEKQRADSEFLTKIDKTAIKSQLLKEQREAREQETLLLFLMESKISKDAFLKELKRIWAGDSVMYHRYYDKYIGWYFDKGRLIVPPDPPKELR